MNRLQPAILWSVAHDGQRVALGVDDPHVALRALGLLYPGVPRARYVPGRLETIDVDIGPARLRLRRTAQAPGRRADT